MNEIKIFSYDYIDELQRKIVVHNDTDDYFLEYFPAQERWDIKTMVVYSLNY
jgi:hypothetical protein